MTDDFRNELRKSLAKVLANIADESQADRLLNTYARFEERLSEIDKQQH